MTLSLARSLGASIGFCIDFSAFNLAMAAAILYPTEYIENAKMKRRLKIKLDKILESERALEKVTERDRPE